MESCGFIIIKPDVSNTIQGVRILDILGSKAFPPFDIGTARLSLPTVKLLYKEHVGQPYFKAHAELMSSGPITYASIALRSPEDNAELRKLVGTTDPKHADPGSIRFNFGQTLPRNAIHVSDNVDVARIERFIVEHNFGFSSLMNSWEAGRS